MPGRLIWPPSIFQKDISQSWSILLTVAFRTASLSVPIIRSTFTITRDFCEEVIFQRIPGDDAKSRTAPLENLLTHHWRLVYDFYKANISVLPQNWWPGSAEHLSTDYASYRPTRHMFLCKQEIFVFSFRFFQRVGEITWLRVEQTDERHISACTALYGRIRLQTWITTPNERRYVWPAKALIDQPILPWGFLCWSNTSVLHGLRISWISGTRHNSETS